MTAGPAPELLRSRRDAPGATRWRVESGPARRGEAWTDLLGHAMRVPFDGGAHGRLVRAHELMHARVSPHAAGAFEAFSGLHPRSVECAEECRVNQLLHRLGFDLAELRDGSERLTGSRLALAGEWHELIWFAGAVAGTRALRDLATGARRVSPSWATACRTLERDLLAQLRGVPTRALASTEPGPDGLCVGFAVHTRALAVVIDRAAATKGRAARAGTARRGPRPAATGVFAPLVMDVELRLDRAVRGGRAPRAAPARSGRVVAWPGRLLTDPARRVYARPRRGHGGVVVVDQSGSMALGEEDLARLLAAAPGAFVLGYSHPPGSDGVPNAWVLADRGRTVSVVRPGNVGNGVDGPALRLALSKRRGSEPVVWLSDGQVTDSGDHADAELATQCGRLVLRYGIRMVDSVEEAVLALGSRGRGLRRPRALGRVGRPSQPCPRTWRHRLTRTPVRA